MKVLVPLAQGFEEIEAVTIIDVLRRASIDVTTAALGKNPVVGAHDISVSAEVSIDNVKSKDYKMIVLPGGMPGSKNLKDSDKVISLISEINAAGGYVTAICAAPIALGKAGVLSGKKYTCFPGYEKELSGGCLEPEPVVVDGTLITARGPGCAIAFALKLVEVIQGAQTASSIKKALQVYWM